MLRPILGVTLLACSSVAVFAQPAELSPSFEVASIRPVSPSDLNVMMRGGPDTSDPGLITYSNVSLRQVLVQAYNVKDLQIAAPSWLATDQFDIVAKIPPGATKAEFRLMLQSRAIARSNDDPGTP